MTADSLGVGFVGTGPVTQAIHLPTLARLTELFTVTHVTDITDEIATSVAARVGARSSTSIDELLGDPRVDVVAVCSPHQFHAAQVIDACRAGKKAVLCEKPFATSADEAAEIAAVSAETEVPIIVGAMHAFDPGWLDAVAHWNDLPAKSHTLRSSIVLPPNSRFEDFATEVITRPDPPPAGDVALWTEPGRGDIDLAAALGTLPDTFAGWVVVEVDVPEALSNLRSTELSAEWITSHLGRPALTANLPARTA
jgi:myo-inositol 2-dehydrogenase / D-chiro-inositol 1-dehydrogenase